MKAVFRHDEIDTNANLRLVPRYLGFRDFEFSVMVTGISVFVNARSVSCLICIYLTTCSWWLLIWMNDRWRCQSLPTRVQALISVVPLLEVRAPSSHVRSPSPAGSPSSVQWRPFGSMSTGLCVCVLVSVRIT